jgi:ATP-binding cassette subfamily F protein 3
VSFTFPDPPELSPPFLQMQDMHFEYAGGPQIFREVNLGIWPSSRIAVVGANGAGKSTLLNLLTGLGSRDFESRVKSKSRIKGFRV